ncbi:probable methyltransferase PMT19 [Rhodamnia argentea]|uniref:Methyltransferase n=1 Tax=Rhodamnia argentea TaxID=178133 RepID=A0A8B8NZI7_9MYRT|nr:probable methyltransferase PMT19 [Rhodamnia argentea]
MATPPSPTPLMKLLAVSLLCSLFFLLGSYTKYSITISPPLQAPHLPSPSPCLPLPINFTSIHQSALSPRRPLDFEPHHSIPLPPPREKAAHFLAPCPKNYTNYCPCHDPSRQKRFAIERFFHRERHCPETHERLRCLVPRPVGYRTPFPWPKSRDYAWFKNVPFPRLILYKKTQNWVKLEGDRFFFPGGGTSFPMGAKGYVDLIKRVVPLKSGAIRTVLDVGCGVASFGASLLDLNIITMSIAPVDIHEAQVQFALERGLPAMLGILSTYRLPYPSRSFDMAHCSRCLVPWTNYDGQYLMEIDRVLRPGGYWVLSGPPISWRTSYKGWQREAKELENEQIGLEDLAKRLCWKKIAERGPIAVWRKPTNHVHCIQKLKAWKSPKLCALGNPDAGWYTKLEKCITPLPKVNNIHETSGGTLEKWPKRLNTAPPRTRSEMKERIAAKAFNEDNQLWKKRVSYYKIILKSLARRKYRNAIDMNAGLGGFAAALAKYPVWVMNVVPYDAKNNTLGIIYERGLIGTYMNWCEAFSTYPRTYDLIHANGLFSVYIHKCDILDILLEIYRILRPEGALIIRDHVDIIVKVKDMVDRMRWNGKVFHSENGPYHPQKVLLVDNSEQISS